MFDDVPSPTSVPYETSNGPSPGNEIAGPVLRPYAHGKFIFVGNEKLYIRGVTYGTFKPAADDQEYDRNSVIRDFRMMARHGINTVRVYTVPPRWFLDEAQEAGLRVMIGLPWEQHIAFLDDPDMASSIKRRVRAGVRSCAGHPAVLCYVIGNEIPATVVRWHGPARVEWFLKELYEIAKEEDPFGLVTYVNFPTTEYLQLPFVDFVCFNVYLENEETFNSYLARLQNIAGDRPLVMAEIGLDSLRNGLEQQAEALDWQVRASFANGCAGAFLFSWTDEWYRGGDEITDWDFGLTTRDRQPKPALDAVTKAFREIPFPDSYEFPRISVVVCSYNGSRTIRDCMEGLTQLDYPDYEVIVVNDGSTDNTADIVSEYPFRLISTPNHGLSSARNTGLAASTGEIVAYTDDDARPDPHWLQFLASTFKSTHHAGVGGPNIAPMGDGEIAECVANAPGGPVHVLINDTEAEHIPGCNMAFRRDALLAVGGFDVQYRAAGDDVDLCWRIQENGGTLGFSPGAMVWHHRRNSISDYWKQQVGYGKAEALLERKWPEKYNSAGHLTWQGRLYGKGLTEALGLRPGRIYHGVWGTNPFQSIYRQEAGLFASVFLMPEWLLIVAVLGALTAIGLIWSPLLLAAPLFVIAVAAPVIQALVSGGKASYIVKPDNDKARVKLFLITSMMHLLQPAARLTGRLKHGLTMWRMRGSSLLALPITKTVSYWSELWRGPEDRLHDIEARLREGGAIVQRNGEFESGWDLQIRGGMLGITTLLLMQEEHGQGKQAVRVRTMPGATYLLKAVTVGLLTLTLLAALDNSGIAAIALGLMAAVLMIRALFEMAFTTASAISAIDRIRQRESGILLDLQKKKPSPFTTVGSHE